MPKVCSNVSQRSGGVNYTVNTCSGHAHPSTDSTALLIINIEVSVFDDIWGALNIVRRKVPIRTNDTADVLPVVAGVGRPCEPDSILVLKADILFVNKGEYLSSNTGRRPVKVREPKIYYILEV